MTTESARQPGMKHDAMPEDPARNATAGRLRVLWTVSTLGFAAFTAAAVPRLTNYNAGDMDLCGWTGVVARRLTSGERPYVDFVTPLAPGSLLVSSTIERLSGELRLIDELWLIAACRLLLAGLAYVIAESVASRLTATLVAIATFALLVGSPRDNASEALGQLGLWASVACGARAWLMRPPARGRWFLAAGACAALTLGFDMRSAVAGLSAWALTFGVMALRAPGIRADAAALLRGFGLGGGLVVIEVLLCRSTLGAFAQSVLSDGFALAGGAKALVLAPLRSFMLAEAYSSSLLLTAASVILAAKLLPRVGTPRSSPDADGDMASLEARAALGSVVVVSVAVAAALAVLLLGIRALPKQLMMVTLHVGAISGIGIVIGCAYALWCARSDSGALRSQSQLLGWLLVFSLIAALVRDPWLFGIRPFYGGDVLTAVSLIFVFLAAERSRRSFAAPLLLGLVLSGLFGLKLNRALDASAPVHDGYWSKLYVNHRGLELLEAAKRVRALTSPGDTVLVLPEDPEISALIGRPRPGLRGSVVFSSHYPERLLQEDSAELEQRPPQVIVVHPRRIEQWRPWLATFSPHAAATLLSVHAFTRELPARYRLDSSFRTTYVTDQGALDVWVRERQPNTAEQGAR